MTGWLVLAGLVVLFLIVAASGGGGGHSRLTGPSSVDWEDEDEVDDGERS